MTREEAEITGKIKLRGAELELCQPDHFRQIAVAITPIQGDGRDGSPCSRRIALPLFMRQIVQRKRAEPFALYNELPGFGISRVLSCHRVDTSGGIARPGGLQ